MKPQGDFVKGLRRAIAILKRQKCGLRCDRAKKSSQMHRDKHFYWNWTIDSMVEILEEELR